MAKKTYEQMTAKQTMNRVKDPHMPFNWSINPYRGCAHGCSFCYARATHTFLGMGADDSFQNHIFMKGNAAEALEAQLAKIAKKHQGDLEQVAKQVGLVAIGTATDPYQPVEAKEKLTRKCLTVLAKYAIPTAITTRSPLILRDIEVLRGMNIASVNISINTLNAEVTRRLEPATSVPLKRLETVQALVESGISTGIFIAPILPYITDAANDLEELISAAKEHKAQFAVPSVLRLSPEVKDWYFHMLQTQFPQLLPAYAKLYRKTYVTPAYQEMLRKRVDSLLSKYNMSRKVPEPTYQVQQEPRVEQLSFSF